MTLSATQALACFMGAWLLTGVISGVAMGRRGYERFTWALIGVALGPMVIPLIVSVQRNERSRLRPPRVRPPSGGASGPAGPRPPAG
jgi:hypothetical protein